MAVNTLRISASLVTTGARHGSPSMLCRRLRQEHGIAVTFAEALNILSQLKAVGIVGSMDDITHAHPVLLGREQALGVLELKR